MQTNKLQAFRNLLAEKGIEMTPEEAKEAYRTLKKFIKAARGLSLQDIWDMEAYNKQYADLYKRAKEL